MKLWALSASTGGGHDMRAFALQHWWSKQGGECEVFHPLEASFWGYRVGCELYNLIQRNLPIFHFAYFHFLEIASLHRNYKQMFGTKCFIQNYERFLPDLVVSMHAHLNHGFLDLTQINKKKVSKFAVYCGELADGCGFSRHWVNPKCDLFISPFKEGCEAAIRRGMPRHKTLASGPLLRAPFYKNNQIINKIKPIDGVHLEPDVPVFLLGTGANGVNDHVKVVQSIDQANLNCQIVALCGTNSKTFNHLKKIRAKLKVKVFPLEKIDAESMAKLLKVAHFIFARPGAGLTTEAIATGCPVIFDLSGGCMPQEKNNLNFWEKRTGSLLSCSSSSQLIKILRSARTIPRLEVDMSDSPEMLLRALTRLVTENDT